MFQFLPLVTLARCTTETFIKSDGMCACGFYLENELSWRQAADMCNDLNARLPEIYSEPENTDIFSLKVPYVFYKFQNLNL